MPAERPDPQAMQRAVKRAANKLATTNNTNDLADLLENFRHPRHESNATGPPLGPAWAFIGYITSAGDAFPDQRYNVVPVLINAGDGILKLDPDTIGHEVESYVVENLTERPPNGTGDVGTHSLIDGTWVYVYAAYDANGEDSRLRYFMITGGSGSLPAGQYTGMFVGDVAPNTIGLDYPYSVGSV